MQRHEDDAIVLDAETANEADRRVLLLTGQGELLRALAPSAARSVRRFGATLQPGARIHARWTTRTEQAIPVLEETTLLAAPPTPDPLERYYVVAHVLETAGAFAREGAEDARMFRLLAAVLDRLAAGDDPLPLARYAEAWTMRLAGLLPEFDACALCDEPLAGRGVRIAGERGVFCGAHAPAGARSLGPAAARWIEATRGTPPDRLPAMAPGAADDLARALPALITDFTERPLKAWPALLKLRRTASLG